MIDPRVLDPAAWTQPDAAACSPDQVLQRFNELAEAHNHSIPQQQLQLFVQEHFQPVGQELEPWTPEDWKERYNPGQGTGEGPLGGAASLNSEGPVFFQPPVPADNLRPQPASLGRAAAPALEEAGKEGISVLGLPQSLTEKDGPGRGVCQLRAHTATRAQIGTHFLRTQLPTPGSLNRSSLERTSEGEEMDVHF